MRRMDWEARLKAVIAKHIAAPGKWGRSDCWCMACDAYKAVTGKALLPHLRKYSSEAGGYRLFKKHGFSTVGEALASVLPEVNRLSAMRGDLATIIRDGVESCGVVTSRGLEVKTLYGEGRTITHSAVEVYPVTAINKAFRVE
ncbi:DUF6950 family protein [Oricola thermophila]|uniref:DUF6950 domain-containing protein n=1 Tax=Oricola thermophila TaxID=2742145 RepID=A0A6N1VA35_9HYPH|nr:hypothetical protein [Oricola thermophila]QKV17861.1 hypothetical protein HTY61_05000 [Oricola thermophila]